MTVESHSPHCRTCGIGLFFVFTLALAVGCTAPTDSPANTQDGGSSAGGDATDSDAGESPSIDAAPGDDRPPTVAFSSPANQQEVAGTVTIELAANDDRAVVQVAVAVDGTTLATLTEAPYETSWDTTALLDGPYTLSAIVTDSGGNTATAQVTPVVRNPGTGGDNNPIVSIIYPVHEAVICGTISMQAAATDDSSVSRVEFYLDDTLLGSDATSPYAQELDTVTSGNGWHELRVVAVDDRDQQSQDHIAIEVNNTGSGCDNLPSVVLQSPTDGASLYGTQTVAAIASDDIGVVKVQFFIDNSLIEEKTTAPYSFSWDTDQFSEQAHTLKAIAYDTGGNTGTHEIQLTVDRTEPSAEITSPLPGSAHTEDLVATFTITDNVGIARVVVGEGQTQLEEWTSPPFDTYTWSIQDHDCGATDLWIRVEDAAGHSDYDEVEFTSTTACDVDCDDQLSEAQSCGGSDCDDTDPLTYAGAPDYAGDNLDQDCSDGDGIAPYFVQAASMTPASAIQSTGIDALFVIDSSTSMAEEQAALAANVGLFVNTLADAPGGLPDLHLGVITTNVGAGGYSIQQCEGDGDDGLLQSDPGFMGCSTPTDSFISDVSTAQGGRARNYPGSLMETFACIATVGTRGCGFERPLDAIGRALDGSRVENDGFLRKDATLGVFILTDEDDCSVNDETLFDPSGAAEATLGKLSSFRCAEYAVACDGGLISRSPGSYSECESRSGSYGRDPAEIVSLLSTLDAASVVLSGIWAPVAPFSVSLNTGGNPRLDPSCTGSHGDGAPAVRLTEVASNYAGHPGSVCTDNYGPALQTFAQDLLEARPAWKSCLAGDLLDSDTNATGTQPTCSVTYYASNDEIGVGGTTLPECGTGEVPCYSYYTEPDECPTSDDNLGIRINLGHSALPDTSRVLVDCRYEGCLTENCTGLTTETDCLDGLDNDNDGFLDCNDSDCSVDLVCPGVAETLVCAAADDLGSGLGYAVGTGDTSTGIADIEGTCGVEGGADVAFHWAAPSAGQFMVVIKAAFATTTHVLDTTCDERLACDDANGGGSFTIDVTSGQEIYFSVGGHDGDSNGEFTLSIAACESPGNCPQGEDAGCSDGIDNNVDGYIDCADSSCGRNSICVEDGDECGDGLDNDGDKMIDCEDWDDCWSYPACATWNSRWSRPTTQEFSAAW